MIGVDTPRTAPNAGPRRIARDRHAEQRRRSRDSHCRPGDTFRAVADASRRTLLDALAEGPKTFQQLHALLPLTKGAVSQHLSILFAAGLVSVVVAADRSRTYSLVPEPLQEIDDWVDRYRHFWTRYLDGLGEAMRRHRASRPHARNQVGGRSGAPAAGDARRQSLPTSDATVAAT